MEWLNIFMMFLSSIIFNQDLSLTATFDVTKFGAVGNGDHDDSQAFGKAWDGACTSSLDAIMVVPGGKTYFLSPLLFKGPCKAPSIHVQIDGNLVGPNDPSEWKGCIDNTWIVFSNVDKVKVYGKGNFNGNGLPWWKNVNQAYKADDSNDIDKSLNQIKDINICSRRPAVLKFTNCNNLELKGLTFVNPPNNHISIRSCNNFRISHITILAPEHSPNTDGIDISYSTNINITNSKISTGDDCIAITSGCSNILVEGVKCGPGHGISVGSLGKGGSYATVEGISVRNCTFIGTQNGARIKTWQGGRGYAKNITFDDIHLFNVWNPIVIDQNYFCKHNHNCSEQANAVQVSDVKFTNIRGSSSSMEAINIDCSKNVPCNNIVVNNTNIWKSSKIKNVYASCHYAKIWSSSTYPKLFC